MDDEIDLDTLLNSSSDSRSGSSLMQMYKEHKEQKEIN
jgi:hypothetical protein